MATKAKPYRWTPEDDRKEEAVVAELLARAHRGAHATRCADCGIMMLWGTTETVTERCEYCATHPGQKRVRNWAPTAA